MNKGSDEQRDINREWAEVLELLTQSRNPWGVMHLVAEGVVPMPEWARKMMARYLREQWPKFPHDKPKHKADDAKLLAAVRAYRDPASKRRGEKAPEREERIAREHGTTSNKLHDYLNSLGGLRKREKAWKEWEKVYLAPDHYTPDKP